MYALSTLGRAVGIRGVFPRTVARAMAALLTALVCLVSFVTVSNAAVRPAATPSAQPAAPSQVSPGTIAGTVTAATGGAGLGTVTVDVYDSIGNYVTSITTAPNGTYAINGLAPSTPGYTVCFDATNADGGSSATGYASQCYLDIPWEPQNSAPARAMPVAVTSGTTTSGIDAALVSEGGISGKVVAAIGGQGLQKVGVRIFDSSGTLVTDTVTRADGTYSVGGLPASSVGYTVCFNAANAREGSSTTGYASECYRDTGWDPAGPAPAASTPVPVIAGRATTGINADLVAAGAISGKVSAATGGAGLNGVLIDLYDSNKNYLQTGNTSSDGSYAIEGLHPSAGYIVCFNAKSAGGGTSATGYASECYRDVAWTGDQVPNGTTPVPVIAGATTADIDIALPSDGAIAGKVTAADGGGALGSVFIDVFDRTGTLVASQTTAADGTYSVPLLTATVPDDYGTPGYTVCFDAVNAYGGSSTTGYSGQCYQDIAWIKGAPIPDGTTPVVVTGGKTTGDVDAALTAAGAIIGTVTAATGGAGLGNVDVRILDGTGTLRREVLTTADGNYQVRGLPALTPGYLVCFDATTAQGGTSTNGYHSQCYHHVAWTRGQPAPAGTTPVPVAVGATSGNIRAVLTSKCRAEGPISPAPTVRVPPVPPSR